MKLGRLSQLEAGKILEELAELESKIEYYNSLLADEQKILAVVSQETKDLANRVGSKDKRLTIIHPEEIGQSNLEDFIKEEEVVVLISNKGFAKRIPVEEYKAQGRAGKGSRTTKLQDEDFVEHMFVASTHEYVMYVTDEGKAYYTKVFEIPEASKNAKGSSIKNLLQLSTAEKITTIFNFKEFDEDKYLMVATKLGVVKRCRLDLFKNARSKGVIAIILDEGDQLLHCEFVQDEDDVMLVTKNGLGLRMSALDVRAMGRATHGVRGIKLRDDDNVAGLLKVDPSKRILMVTEKGKGKQVGYDQFMNHHRGTLGQKIFRLTDKGSSIINAVSVNDENDIVCVTLLGQTIRIHVRDISTQGRNASGVKVVTMKSSDDSIVALASTYIDDEDSVELEEQVVTEQENK